MSPPRLILGLPSGHQPTMVVGELGAQLDLDPYLPLRAASAYVGLSVRSLRSWLVHPTCPLPCYRVGGKILLRRSELDRWLSGFRRRGREDIEAVVDGVLADFAKTA